MTFDVHSEKRNTFVHAEISGEVTSADIQKEHLGYEKICVSCREHECDKALVDITGVMMKPSCLDVFCGAVAIEQHFGGSIKTAFVASHPEFAPDSFFEDVARNRATNMKCFLAVEDAIEWLETSG